MRNQKTHSWGRGGLLRGLISSAGIRGALPRMFAHCWLFLICFPLSFRAVSYASPRSRQLAGHNAAHTSLVERLAEISPSPGRPNFHLSQSIQILSHASHCSFQHCSTPSYNQLKIKNSRTLASTQPTAPLCWRREYKGPVGSLRRRLGSPSRSLLTPHHHRSFVAPCLV